MSTTTGQPNRKKSGNDDSLKLLFKRKEYVLSDGTKVTIKPIFMADLFRASEIVEKYKKEFAEIKVFNFESILSLVLKLLRGSEGISVIEDLNEIRSMSIKEPIATLEPEEEYLLAMESLFVNWDFLSGIAARFLNQIGVKFQVIEEVKKDGETIQDGEDPGESPNPGLDLLPE